MKFIPDVAFSPENGGGDCIFPPGTLSTSLTVTL